MADEGAPPPEGHTVNAAVCLSRSIATDTQSSNVNTLHTHVAPDNLTMRADAYAAGAIRKDGDDLLDVLRGRQLRREYEAHAVVAIRKDGDDLLDVLRGRQLRREYEAHTIGIAELALGELGRVADEPSVMELVFRDD
eukprot:CAMPEP_0195158458 /NCGR_PEP_ID=MMETSP0448-20130528/185676_1 /TAXON_ID=66468 /ORGANISM="Heterocapsa triquestra, Strain CCMP 448" /LENGTH=137 /DNA_ID=CAMNT_0040197257 /DNA_START=274 /DNA_END=685 /DNA_ORIENTATION=+